ncbi:MAG: TPM domain-containing protein [Clostridia bacterium]
MAAGRKALRFVKHLFVPDWYARSLLSTDTLRKIEEAIRASEREHDGQLRFVAEASLPLQHLFRKHSSRRRAEDLFAALRVWDTERNSGVLIYVQLVSRHIDVVADRGIARKVSQAEWEEVCRAMETAFRRGEFAAGSLEGIARATRLLKKAFPKTAGGDNELPDRPVVL